MHLRRLGDLARLDATWRDLVVTAKSRQVPCHLPDAKVLTSDTLMQTSRLMQDLPYDVLDHQQELDGYIQLIDLLCWGTIHTLVASGDRLSCEPQKHPDRRKCNQSSTEQEYPIYDVKTMLDIIRDAENKDYSRNSVLGS